MITLETLKRRRANKNNGFTLNPASDDGLRWVENVSKSGWRYIGFADEITRLGHKAWFTSDDCDESLRGIVYQLPTRKDGIMVFAIGYKDPNNEDCARLVVTTDCDDKEDAAREADGIAERDAESEREYNEAYRLGQAYTGQSEIIANERETRRKLKRELRTLRSVQLPNVPTVCGTIRAAIDRSRLASKTAYKARKDMIETAYLRGEELLMSFADGAELSLDEAKIIF